MGNGNMNGSNRASNGNSNRNIDNSDAPVWPEPVLVLLLIGPWPKPVLVLLLISP